MYLNWTQAENIFPTSKGKLCLKKKSEETPSPKCKLELKKIVRNPEMLKSSENLKTLSKFSKWIHNEFLQIIFGNLVSIYLSVKQENFKWKNKGS